LRSAGYLKKLRLLINFALALFKQQTIGDKVHLRGVDRLPGSALVMVHLPPEAAARIEEMSEGTCERTFALQFRS
jgi:nickel-dependent lactate racemase